MTPADQKPRTTARIGRRQFMRRSAGAIASALALPNIISSRAWAEAAPSNRLTLGFIGIGKQMRGHIGHFLGRSRVQVVALCDVESIRLGIQQKVVNDFYAEREGAGSYAGCEIYGDFRELIGRSDIDAVVIATPDHWHAIPAVAAMQSGKDVYCEKPLSLTIAEGKAMVAAARQYGRVFQTGSQQRSDREFRIACELVRNGRIGEVQTVYVNVGPPSVECYLPAEPVPEGLDWDFWLGPAPWRPYNSDIAPAYDFQGWPNFRAYRDYSGGGMTDWGAHHFDIAQWGLGMDGSGPVEIHPPDGRDYPRLTYIYANGVRMIHGAGSDERAGVEFVGTEGRVMVNRGYLATEPARLRDEPIGPTETHLYNSRGHHEDWLDAIEARTRPICDVEIGYRSVTVCHLGNIGYWLKRPLRWDPVNQEFLDDPGANRLLKRSMRSPWHIA